MRVLFFYPHNPFEHSHGSHTRVLQLIRHLKNKGCTVDLLALNGFTNAFPEAMVGSPELVDGCFPVQWRGEVGWPDPWILVMKLWRKLRRGPAARPKVLHDLCFPGLLDTCAELMKRNAYDAFIVSYVMWAGLAQCAPRSVLKILNLQDIWTFQECRGPDGFCRDFGTMFEDEVSRIQAYDYVINISNEEKALLGHFMPPEKLKYVPVFFEDNSGRPAHPSYHAVFVGSDNPHNVLGLRWFCDHVEPLVHPEIKIAVVGKVCDAVECRSPRIHRLGRVEDLDAVYRASSFALSCLLTGTGQKIKVVEALSYGLPVLATTAGLRGVHAGEADGCFAADTPEEFARYMNRLGFDEDFRADAGRRAHLCFLGRFTEPVACRELDALLFPCS